MKKVIIFCIVSSLSNMYGSQRQLSRLANFPWRHVIQRSSQPVQRYLSSTVKPAPISLSFTNNVTRLPSVIKPYRCFVTTPQRNTYPENISIHDILDGKYKKYIPQDSPQPMLSLWEKIVSYFVQNPVNEFLANVDSDAKAYMQIITEHENSRHSTPTFGSFEVSEKYTQEWNELEKSINHSLANINNSTSISESQKLSLLEVYQKLLFFVVAAREHMHSVYNTSVDPEIRKDLLKQKEAFINEIKRSSSIESQLQYIQDTINTLSSSIYKYEDGSNDKKLYTMWLEELKKAEEKIKDSKTEKELDHEALKIYLIFRTVAGLAAAGIAE